ncbi:MAG: hypothetical protein NT023_06390 [Armatimonadetes bacterium]|nr:hypothetical protein [Armatimonadota bacterium]
MNWNSKTKAVIVTLITLSANMTNLPRIAWAHDDENKPKTPTKAQKDLKKAREAMDAYKTRLAKDGKFSCCMQKPVGAKVDGCDTCAKTSGSCQCGANLAIGKGVCGECYGAWKSGKGNTAFGKVDVKALKILASDFQGANKAGEKVAETPERTAYLAAMTTAKRTLIGEKRYSCCVGNGGCDECAHEGYCPCGRNLAKDMEAKPTDKKRGICAQCLDGQHGGHARVGKGLDVNQIMLAEMDMEMMPGLLGVGSMNREGSGTSWLPESSPTYGKMTQRGRWQTMQMGLGFGSYTAGGSERAEKQLYFPSQYMLMGRREVGGGVVGLRVMVSADPLLIGGNGYPNLFQTGETYLGKPLKDRQHPHDLFMELAASYSRPIGGGSDGKRNRAFLYFAPVGEPAVGMAAFQHRPSAWDNPVSPITHHWLDGTHITFGVATAGLTFGDKWKLEGSVFTGREPDENRYDFDPMRFDSYSGRLTFNPDKNWSLQASYAFLHSPETLEPSSNPHRLTLSAQYNRAFASGDNFAGLFGYGKNIKDSGSSDALLLEGAYTRGHWTAFGRWESVAKDELVSVPVGTYRVNKFTLGGIYNFQQSGASEQGLGASLDFYKYPASLSSSYGDSPVTFNLFYRLRFGKM